MCSVTFFFLVSEGKSAIGVDMWLYSASGLTSFGGIVPFMT